MGLREEFEKEIQKEQEGLSKAKKENKVEEYKYSTGQNYNCNSDSRVLFLESAQSIFNSIGCKLKP